MKPEHSARAAIRRVLTIFPGALGDLMCAMPAIEAIARRHVGTSIELMARAELARLAVGRSVVARGHSIDAREVGALFTDEPSDDARRLFSQFERIYSFFAYDDARFRERLVATTDGEVSFHPFRPEADGHVAEAYLRAIREAGSVLSHGLEPNADDLAAAELALRQSGWDGSDFIVMFPGSGSPAKNWAANKYSALARMLGVGSGILRSADSALNDKGGSALCERAVVVLGPAEEAIETIFREAGVRVLKNLELPTVAGIARLASAYVGNDSGVSHLAAAVGTSGVVIFGPTDPGRWRPMPRRPGQRIEICRSQPINLVETREVASLLSKICSASSNIID